jgi:hypothetical protein
MQLIHQQLLVKKSEMNYEEIKGYARTKISCFDHI